ncbi:porphobilinogen synthase [Vibrio variabilis]|uniref:Porphobilinogen synthase n=1 Tax=Vibrio variabilis TaxID=990271 RepID=A0ABQ0J8N7_9VIBR|nr:porphobilinogen synthase [Vibrio variabilis]
MLDFRIFPDKERKVSVSIQGQFPARRMRRMRKHDFSRRLMAENKVSVMI